MWPVIAGVLRTYAPAILWPCAFVIGVIGYNFENIVRKPSQLPDQESTLERRSERLLSESEGKDMTHVDRIKDKVFVPKTIFNRNLDNKES